MNKSSGSKLGKIFPIFLIILVSGCSTPAERNELRAFRTWTEIEEAFNQCIGRVGQEQDALIQAVIGKLGPNADSVTTAQLADQTRPSRHEIENIQQIVDSYRVCEQAYWTQLSPIAPRNVEASRRFIDARSQNVVALSRDRLTWGEYNRRRVSAWRSYQQESRNAFESTVRDYATASAESRARLQEAADRLAEWGRERDARRLKEQAIMNQRMNSMPRPSTTDCVRTPYGYSCSSN